VKSKGISKLRLASKTQFNGVGRLRTYITFTHRRARESSTMDCPISLNGNVYSMHDWPDGLRGQAVFLRKLAKQANDPVVKNELLELASFCEEVADNIEDHLTGDKPALAGAHRC
jgi:hypothetical protein